MKTRNGLSMVERSGIMRKIAVVGLLMFTVSSSAIVGQKKICDLPAGSVAGTLRFEVSANCAGSRNVSWTDLKNDLSLGSFALASTNVTCAAPLLCNGTSSATLASTVALTIAGTASKCARFDSAGHLVAASADCSAGDTVGSGTVSSVGLSVPSWLSVSGSPVTTTGTLAVTAATGQTSGRVIGTCGAGTSVSLCALVAGDLPTVTAAKGGTGVDTSASSGVLRVSSGTWTANAGISHLASSTSADLAGVLSNETGSGAAVFGTSPTMTNSVINQAANGDVAVTATRATDTAPTGNFLLLKSAAGSTLSAIDISGRLGIGAIPAYSLDIATSVAGDANTRIQNTSATGISGFLLINNVGTTTAAIGQDNGLGQLRINSVQNQPISFRANGSEFLRMDSAGHLNVLGTAPTASCTGIGTSPPAATVAGTDSAFTVTVNTGTSPSSSGTCTVTFASAFTTNAPIMVCMLVDGASAWGVQSVIHQSTQSTSAPVLAWSNVVALVATNLTASSSYKFDCMTKGRL